MPKSRHRGSLTLGELAQGLLLLASFAAVDRALRRFDRGWLLAQTFGCLLDLTLHTRRLMQTNGLLDPDPPPLSLVKPERAPLGFRLPQRQGGAK